MDFYIGMVGLFVQNSKDYILGQGWVKCDGRLLEIGRYGALFAVLGTEFGGDGITTFGVPKMSPVKTENGAAFEYYMVTELGMFPEEDNYLEKQRAYWNRVE